MKNLKQIRPHYFIDSDGNVYSNMLRGSKFGSTGPLLPLKPRFTNKGHAYVDFGKTGGRHYVHHLVLETFGSPRPKGLLALHKDDNKLNNSISNLYWGTYKENSADAKRNGTFKTQFFKGMKPKHATSPKVVNRILELKKQGKGLKEISLTVGVSPTTVWKFCSDPNYVAKVKNLPEWSMQ